MEKLDFDKNKVLLIEIDKVRPNTWNPKEKDTQEYQMVKRGIETNGLKLPIRVRENNGYEIIDGEQRWRACKELGYTHILIYNEGKISDKEAKEMTTWWQHQVPFSEVELAKLIKEITNKYEDVNLPFTNEQLENYKNLIDFDFDSFKEDETALESGNQEIAIYKVTLEQKETIDQAIEIVREKANNDYLSGGRCLELICADYIAGRWL